MRNVTDGSVKEDLREREAYIFDEDVKGALGIVVNYH